MRSEGAVRENNRGCCPRADLVLDHHRVLAVDHENAFLDLDPLHSVSEPWKWIEPELRKIAVPFRVNGANVLIRREVIMAAVDQQRFFHLREENDPADW